MLDAEYVIIEVHVIIEVLYSTLVAVSVCKFNFSTNILYII